MHVIIFRIVTALAFLFIFSVLLGACAKPVERNVWREWLENTR